MNIIIPMAGLGTRTKDYASIPKPLIEINGKTIVEWSVNSLGIEGHYIFITRKFKEYNDWININTKLNTILKTLKPNCTLIETDELTEGPVSTILLAEALINNDEELVITNCDQMLNWNSNVFLNHIKENKLDACVTTYPHKNIEINKKSPYSFVQINENNVAVKFEEKFAISEKALNGIHYWKSGKDFVSSAKEMIQNNDRVNNEFYVSKTFNYLISKGKKISIYHMNKEQFFALGSTKEIKEYQDGNI